MTNDEYLAYWRCGPQNNYKPERQVETIGGVMSDPNAFETWYRVVFLVNSQIREVLEEKQTVEQVRDSVADLLKHLTQFYDDHPDQKEIVVTLKLLVEIFILCLAVLGLGKGKSAIEVADFVLSNDEIKTYSTNVSQFVKSLPQALSKEDGFSLIQFGFMSIAVDLLGDCFKHITPNLKKKKDDKITEYKNWVKDFKSQLNGISEALKELKGQETVELFNQEAVS